MAINYVEHTSRRLSVGEQPATAPTIATPAAFANFDTVEWKFVPGVTGLTLSNTGNEKDVTDLGSGGERKMLQETTQLSMAVVIQYRLDESDDTFGDDEGHEIIATASQAKGTGNLVWVRYDFPQAAESARVNTTDVNTPTEGDVCIFLANVAGGDLGLGGGGTGGGFEESAYTLKSFGRRYVVDVA